MAIKRCKASFAASVGGLPRVMRTGTLVSEDDPIIKGREHLFEDAETHVQERARVEDTSAAPGRRRSLSRPARKAAAAKPKPAKRTTAEQAPKADTKQETEQAGSQDADKQEGNAS